VLEMMMDVLHTMASRGGRPKPSNIDGYTNRRGSPQ
jgi:hypothetical protein